MRTGQVGEGLGQVPQRQAALLSSALQGGAQQGLRGTTPGLLRTVGPEQVITASLGPHFPIWKVVPIIHMIMDSGSAHDFTRPLHEAPALPAIWLFPN